MVNAHRLLAVAGAVAAFALFTAVPSRTAFGQIGTDLIIGDLSSIANYNPVNGVDAFSLSLTTCNQGSVAANWDASNADHPVFLQTLYRLFDSRLEMIGRSSIKHGFFPLSQSLCGSCFAAGSTALGTGCSDTMSASIVGSQSGSSTSENINAFSGVFPFPPTDLNTTGNGIFKRLQVATTDMDPALYPNAKYFVQAQVISADDAAASNGTNNMSWREITILGGPNNYNATLAPGSSTKRTESVLNGWQDEDPAVQIVPVLIPGEGRFLVGYRGTPVGPNLWQYEFALQNINSDLAAKSFRIEFLPGANISNIGFHDLAYHSGAPFDDSDWSVNLGNDSIEWTSDSFASDPNGNALRFGSLYNFRFTSDMPPTDLSIFGELTTFKASGAPAHNFVVLPASVLTLVSGEGARANIGEVFDQDIVVHVETTFGTPVQGAVVSFTSGATPAVIIPGTELVFTDVNGNASISLAALAGFGPVTLEANFNNQVVPVNDLFVRRFDRLFTGPSGVLIFFFSLDWANQPIALAIDDPSVTPTVTDFGTITTSLLNPGPSFYGESGDLGSPLVFQPSLVTTATGSLSQIYTGLASLHNSGITLNHQAYALRVVQGQLEVYISNTITATY